MAYGHSSGLPPLEASVMIAEKRKLFFSFSVQMCLSLQTLMLLNKTLFASSKITADSNPGIPDTQSPLLNLGNLLLSGCNSVTGLPDLIGNPIPPETVLGLSLYHLINAHLSHLLIAHLVQYHRFGDRFDQQ